MHNYLHVLVVGRHQDVVDSVVRLLEGNGHIVASTLSDATALDLAYYSEFDAVVIGSEVARPDRGYLTTEILKKKPSTVVVAAQSPQSVLTQLRQAFKESDSARSG